MHEAILDFYERVLPKDDVEAVIHELKSLGPRILGRTISRVELAPVDDFFDATRIPLKASDGSMVAMLVLDEPLAQDFPWEASLFLKMAAWSIHRITLLLNEDTGPERFVAATLGYCHPDGRVEYVCCGQAPLFIVRHGEIQVLPECEPPLGMFAELDFSIQSLNLESGEGLVAVTDGVLEWEDDSARMFGEAGVAALLARPCHSSESVLQLIVQGLTDFWLPPSQRDDVCCLAILRTA